MQPYILSWKRFHVDDGTLEGSFFRFSEYSFFYSNALWKITKKLLSTEKYSRHTNFRCFLLLFKITIWNINHFRLEYIEFLGFWKFIVFFLIHYEFYIIIDFEIHTYSILTTSDETMIFFHFIGIKFEVLRTYPWKWNTFIISWITDNQNICKN